MSKEYSESIEREDVVPTRICDAPTQKLGSEEIEPQTVNDVFLNRLIDNRYLVVSRIARGGMATVYRGRDERLDRPVAIKIMHPHLAETPDLVTRFRREARAIAKLSHPSIVAVHDQGIVDGCGYLIMELVPGLNLRQELLSRGSFTIRDALDATYQILNALAIAHEADLIHRDVKPENVLVMSPGQFKVADFGLARAVSDVTAATTGSVLGTVAYLAPELITGGDADSRTDLYSVGIMLYELIASVPPYQGSTPIRIAYAHVHSSIPSLSESIPWIPEPVDALIGCLAATDKEERPRNASEAAQLVATVLQSLDTEILNRRVPIEPTPIEAPKDVIEQIQRNTLMYSLGTTALPTDAVSKHRRNRRLSKMGAAVLASLVFLMAIVSGTSWYFFVGPGAYIPTPDMIGIGVPQAREIAMKHHLGIEISEKNDDQIPVGTIIATNPAPKEGVKKNGTVTLIVSKGVLMVSIPDLKGQSLEEAQNAIKQLQLGSGEITHEYSNDIPEGKVVNTTPIAGTTVRHDTSVSIVISKGREPIKVPNLVGKKAEEAQELLKDLGLDVSVESKFSDDIPEGEVISQLDTPANGFFKGDKFSYAVSKGPDSKPVPRVIGRSMSSAKKMLEDAGFKVIVQKANFGLGNLPNIVYNQSPAPGQKLKIGSTVTLYYV